MTLTVGHYFAPLRHDPHPVRCNPRHTLLVLAGADAVAVGTATFVDPMAALKIIDGIARYLEATGAKSVSEIVGQLLV